MISLSIGGDGVVHLRLCHPRGEGDEQDYLDALDRISSIQAPFVMIVDLKEPGHLSREGELRQAAWAKATREHIAVTCRALALVKEKPSERSRRSFERLWSIPVHVTNDRDEALRFALHHLNEQNRTD
ncbi:hypothetical protein [Pleomorphomonas sp. NRK KF1]|uniref:hypothetical protein n=1 Tax=Pleomorphomonas sp. NRK KF1 TaxID=2943000 RepID=UPI0020442DC6|nr:hypothetical protein [Pleomorphomonas sp. NRK KF1]MCM5553888.1 hypothetical protein [Pleomorphomonas sp. NRK KF1]